MKINNLIKEFLIETLSNCKKSTFNRYKYVFDKYIIKYFNDQDIKKIKVSDINLWKIEINKTKLSYQSKKKIYIIFSSLFNYAYRVYNISNILHRCKPFKNNEKIKEYNYYTLEEFKLYNEQIKDPEHKVIFNILFYLGLRRGELLALTKEDIKNNKIIINKSSRKKIISTPKTIYSYREIPLPKFILDLIQEMNIKRKKIPKDNKIFTISETNLARYNKIYATKANLKIIRIHDFRHSNINFLCRLNIAPSAIAKRVGHKNIKEIYETYLHTSEEEQKQINNIIDKIK